ncbi:unnamed protein product [Amoebophrya sp. A25]|nr:unnamed protein product [Amoebophrya sp. A25]|eukprot:GSA25T00012972001.1
MNKDGLPICHPAKAPEMQARGFGAMVVSWLYPTDSYIIGHQTMARVGYSLPPSGPGETLGAYLFTRMYHEATGQIAPLLVPRAPTTSRNINYYEMFCRQKGVDAKDRKAARGKIEEMTKVISPPQTVQNFHRLVADVEVAAQLSTSPLTDGAAVPASKEPAEASSHTRAFGPAEEILPCLVSVFGQYVATDLPEVDVANLCRATSLPSPHLEVGAHSAYAASVAEYASAVTRDFDDEEETPFFSDNDFSDDSDEDAESQAYRAALDTSSQPGIDDPLRRLMSDQQIRSCNEWVRDAEHTRRLRATWKPRLLAGSGWTMVVLIFLLIFSMAVGLVESLRRPPSFVSNADRRDESTKTNLEPKILGLWENDARTSAQIASSMLRSDRTEGAVQQDAAKGYFQWLLSSRLQRFMPWVFNVTLARPLRMFLGWMPSPQIFCAGTQTFFGRLQDPGLTTDEICDIFGQVDPSLVDDPAVLTRLSDLVSAHARGENSTPLSVLHDGESSFLTDSDPVFVVRQYRRAGHPDLAPVLPPAGDVPDLQPGLSDSEDENISGSVRVDGHIPVSPLLEISPSGDPSSDFLPTDAGSETTEKEQSSSSAPCASQNRAVHHTKRARASQREAAEKRVKFLNMNIRGEQFLIPYVDDLNFVFVSALQLLFRLILTLVRSLQTGCTFSLKKLVIAQVVDMLGWRIDVPRRCRVVDPDKAAAIRAFKWDAVCASTKSLTQFLAISSYLRDAFYDLDTDYLASFQDPKKHKGMKGDAKAAAAFEKLIKELSSSVELSEIDVPAARSWYCAAPGECGILRISVDASLTRVACFVVQKQKIRDRYVNRLVLAMSRKFSKEAKKRVGSHSLHVEIKALVFFVRAVRAKLPKAAYVLHFDNSVLSLSQLWSVCANGTIMRSLLSSVTEVLTALSQDESYLVNVGRVGNIADTGTHQKPLPEDVKRERFEDLVDLIKQLYGKDKLVIPKVEAPANDEAPRPLLARRYACLCSASVAYHDQSCGALLSHGLSAFRYGAQLCATHAIRKSYLQANVPTRHLFRLREPGQLDALSRYSVQITFPSTAADVVCAPPLLVCSVEELEQGFELVVTAVGSKNVSVTPKVVVTCVTSGVRVTPRFLVVVQIENFEHADASPEHSLLEPELRLNLLEYRTKLTQGASDEEVERKIEERLQKARNRSRLSYEDWHASTASLLMDRFDKTLPLLVKCIVVKSCLVLGEALWTEGVEFPTIEIARAYHPIKPNYTGWGRFRKIQLEGILAKILDFHRQEMVLEGLLADYLPFVHGVPAHVSSMFLAVRLRDILARLICEAVELYKGFMSAVMPLFACADVWKQVLLALQKTSASEYLSLRSSPNSSSSLGANRGVVVDKPTVPLELPLKRPVSLYVFRVKSDAQDSIALTLAPKRSFPPEGRRDLRFRGVSEQDAPYFRFQRILRTLFAPAVHPPRPCNFVVYDLVAGADNREEWESLASRRGGYRVDMIPAGRVCFPGFPVAGFECRICVLTNIDGCANFYTCGRAGVSADDVKRQAAGPSAPDHPPLDPDNALPPRLPIPDEIAFQDQEETAPDATREEYDRNARQKQMNDLCASICDGLPPDCTGRYSAPSPEYAVWIDVVV